MFTIHKQPLQVAVDIQYIEVPARASFLSVQLQRGAPCVWYACEDNLPKAPRRVAIAGTGHDASHCDGLRFLGTFQLDGGALVFHVFVEG